MLKSHEKFHSRAGKRLILIVDDEQVNRELLGHITSKDFDAIYAADGRQAMQQMKENHNYISLVLLDLKMPVMDGFEVMRRMKEREELEHIPVIVLTSDESAEVDCLALGASDFIVKPFSVPEVIIARMRKTIELNEDRSIIRSTERDGLTGLFNTEYFYRYADQFDKFHSDLNMDAIALDINHFHLINELYGRQTGDEVLRHLAEYLKDLREKTGCIVCRPQGDKFFIYMPNGKVEYSRISEEINQHFEKFHDIYVRIRSGIYLNADKDIEMERRFDRAVRAANTIKDNYTRLIAYYDASIHEKKIFEDRLLNEVDDAIAGNQFYLNYQPKYNIEGDKPVLVSAEALVRWKHPYLGTISPGIFIPLLEKNGLIQKLDFFIWDKALKAVNRWNKGLQRRIPVSVNVSRMDLYSSELIDYLNQKMKENDLRQGDVYLEITESAYMDDAELLIGIVDKLRENGFKIEMDDFGTGYSSLNMLADVPVDVLKLDMRFVQTLHTNQKQETLIRLVMDIAAHLGIEVVAEGVEDKEQVEFLKEVGCQTVQGYYFSKPLSEEDFLKCLREEEYADN